MSQISRNVSNNPAIETLTGNTGGPVGPTGGNINVIGDDGITVTGNPGTSTLTITPDGTIATTYTTDAGNAIPALGVLNVLGGTNATTSGVGNTITIDVTATGTVTTLTGDTGGAVGPDGSGNISILAQPTAGTTVVLAGTPASNLLELNVTDADGNTYIGLAAGNLPTTGLRNTGLGFQALAAISSGTDNTAVGHNSMSLLNTGSLNTAVGVGALAGITNNTACTAVGYNALLAGTGGDNSAFGASSLLGVTIGSGNAASGSSCLIGVTSGSNNAGSGFTAGASITTGSRNTAIGYATMQRVLASMTGDDNTVVGAQSLQGISSGNSNTVLGYSSGNSATGASSSNIYIRNAGAAESNTIRIGTAGSGTGQQNRCFIAGIDGVNVGSTATVVTESGTQLGTAVITAGSGITVTPGANTITIAATASAFTWSVIAADQTAVVNNGYFCNKAGTLALALPAASAVGDTIQVANENTALGIQFTQAAGQQILIGNTNTTLGATGTLTSSAVGDTLTLVCKTANTIWRVTSVVGNWTPA